MAILVGIITFLVGKRQSVRGVRGAILSSISFGTLVSGLVRRWSWQVTELPSGVGWTPALVLANTPATTQTGYLTEDWIKGKIHTRIT